MRKVVSENVKYKIGVTFFFIILCFNLHAQPGDPIGGDPEDIPLDPGSWVLVAAGVGYGVKKWKDSKKQTGKDQTTAAFLKEEDEPHIL